jgi:alpha-tubulin suppressor-like RCC1 family protein
MSQALVPYLQEQLVPHHLFETDAPQEGDREQPVTDTLMMGGEGLLSPTSIPKLAARTIVDIALSSTGAAFLSDSGEVLVAGLNDEGQISPEDPSTRIAAPTLLEALSAQRAHSLAMSDHHVTVLTAGGAPLAWGSNEYLALAHSREVSPPFRVSPRVMRGLLPGALVAQVACGPAHTLVLTRSGEVYAAGSGVRGALGNGDRETRAELTRVGGPLLGVAVCSVAAGNNMSAAVSVSGVAYAWGSNRYGQCGVDPATAGHALLRPTRVPLPELAQQVCAGDAHTLWVSRSGRVWAAGSDRFGQCGASPLPADPGVASEASACLHAPTLVHIGADAASGRDSLRVREVATGARHSLVLTVSGDVFAMGDSRSGATGLVLAHDDGGGCLWRPTRIPALSGQGLFRIAAGGDRSAAVRVVNGSVFSRLPGTLPRGLMSLVDANTLARIARLAGESGDTQLLSRVLNDVIARWTCLGGSFRSDFDPLLVESRAPTPAAKSRRSSTNALRPRTPRMSAESGQGADVPVIVVDDEGNASLPDAPRLLRSSGGVVDGSQAQSPVEEPQTSSSPQLGVPDAKRRALETEDGKRVARGGGAVSGNSAPLTSHRVGACAPSSAAFEGSGIDIAGLESAHGALLLVATSAGQSHLTDLARVRSRVLDEIEPAAAGITEPDAIRALLALWLCPLNALPGLGLALSARLCRVILALPQASRDLLVSWCIRDVPGPVFATRLVKPLQQTLSASLRFRMGGAEKKLVHEVADAVKARDPMTGPITHLTALESCIRVLRLLSNANERAATASSAAVDTLLQAATTTSASANAPSGATGTALAPPVSPEVFYNGDVCALRDEALLLDYRRWAAAGYKRNVALGEVTLCAHAFLLDASAKRRILQLEAAFQMQSAATNAMARSFFSQESPYLVLEVRRSRAVQDALNQLSRLHPSSLRKQLKVIFRGEEGLDAGGVTKDFFQLVMSELLGPSSLVGLFKSDDGRTLFFNPAAPPEFHEDYFLVGVLLGLAIYNSVICPHEVRFPLALYRALLGEHLSWADFEEVRPVFSSNLKKVLDYDGDDVEDVFCLTWTTTIERFGEAVEVELERGGSGRAVTTVNRAAYVSSILDFYLRSGIAGAQREFLRGFALVMSTPSLHLFTARELRLLVEGEHQLDFTALQSAATYEGGYSAEHPTIQSFWRVALSMTPEEKRLLLLFCTGSNQSPIGGLGRLPFKIQRMSPDSERLPTASTCFNTLLLPDYSSEQKLRTKIHTAIRECKEFGLQ